ncbi:hypothetical protein [Tichowtungia aerotolerans]|uniref:Uncharacterized protein n=1 Tax=Tichowtungia aerotolerans TaxID=2697043 RepID=A0A6P1M0V1_9BACT|nr:hypothetical protein [Tichowtungia aerotolerans]QHI68419.1 hypothetical protein GT409_02760 [Tichowtungia aerotolerans]
MNKEKLKQHLRQHAPDMRSKYLHKLETLPPTGAGYHPAILGVANIGVKAGFDDETIFEDIRGQTDECARYVPDSEIWSAVQKARADHEQGAENIPAPPPPTIGLSCAPATLKKRLIQVGRKYSENALLEKSTLQLGGHPFEDSLCLLEAFYAPCEYLFIGSRYLKEPCTVADFKEFIIQDQDTSKMPHIIPNPLTGTTHKTKDGKDSMRCDAAIKEYRFAVAEFDNMSREDQIAFWCAAPFPIAALIDSGGKSIHAWIKLSEIYTPEQWRLTVKETLYRKMLVPMGCDPACANPSRLSRLPGHYREERGRWQRLLYINPAPSPKGIFKS